MPTNEAKKKYDIQYAKNNLKRIPLNVRKEKYEEIKTAAAAAGEPVNRYIKKAIDERMERDAASQGTPQQTLKPQSSISLTEKPEKHYKPFTEEAAAKVDLKRLPNDILYQMDIAEALGANALASLLEKAKQTESHNAENTDERTMDNMTAAYDKSTDATASDVTTYETLDEKLARLHKNHPKPKPIRTEL